MNSSFAPPPPSKSLTAAMPFALNLYLRLGHHLLSAIFSRTGPLLTMVINYVQASSALSMLKATRRDLTILLLYVFSKVYMTHHCNSGVILQKWRLINYHHHHHHHQVSGSRLANEISAIKAIQQLGYLVV